MTENTSQPPPKRGDLDFLRAVLDHANHRGLGDTIGSTASPSYEGYGQVWPTPIADPRVLLRWIDSLTGPHLSIRDLTENIHLLANGTLSNGTPVGVCALLCDTDVTALRANMTVEKGAPVDIDLLRRLTSAAAAEAEAVPAVSS